MSFYSDYRLDSEHDFGVFHHDPDRDVVMESESLPGDEENKKMPGAGRDDLTTIMNTGSPLAWCNMKLHRLW